MKILFVFFIHFQLFSQQKLEVFFDFNKSDINLLAKNKLDSLIKNVSTLEISKIEGFCDSVDSNSYNKILSLKRAQKVLNYFKANSIKPADNLEIKPIGEIFEQATNQSKNRKVIVYFNSNDLKIKVNNAKKGDFIKLKNINFMNNSNIFLPKSCPTLFDLLTVLETKPTLKIEIQGHICCQNRSFYDTISTARAKAVYDFLIVNKVNKNRLQYKGFGVLKPVFSIPEQSDFEREQNRRVEILILEN